MILILILVRSMKEANLVLFIAVLQKLAPYFFATDHTSYARWLSVFIHDLETLPVTNPNLYRVFRAVQSSNCTGFSKMAIDQALKQNNKTIKATNGDINAVNQENKTKFLRMIKDGKPYKSKRPNKDYTPISICLF